MTVRWGIAGTGRIAGDFARALRRVPDGELAAVSSRTQARAVEFASEHRAGSAHGSFEALLADDAVDAVYVASPHTEHCAQTVAALGAGKHVLCEKPFAMSTAEGEEMAAAARDKQLFLMEALWSRFLPAYVRLKELVDSGAIGEVRGVHASFGFVAPDEPERRLLNPSLGGGALMDLGVYPLNLGMWLLGEPETVQATAVLGPTGVDLDTSWALGWGRATGTGHVSLSAYLPTTGYVAGTEAWVELPLPFHRPDALTIRRYPDEPVVEEHPVDGDGLRFEIAHIHECLAEGLTESPVMPLEGSLAFLRTLDRIRSACA